MTLNRKAFLQGRETIPANDRAIPDRQRKSIPVATSNPSRGSNRSNVGCSVNRSWRDVGSEMKIIRFSCQYIDVPKYSNKITTLFR